MISFRSIWVNDESQQQVILAIGSSSECWYWFRRLLHLFRSKTTQCAWFSRETESKLVLGRSSSQLGDLKATSWWYLFCLERKKQKQRPGTSSEQVTVSEQQWYDLLETVWVIDSSLRLIQTIPKKCVDSFSSKSNKVKIVYLEVSVCSPLNKYRSSGNSSARRWSWQRSRSSGKSCGRVQSTSESAVLIPTNITTWAISRDHHALATSSSSKSNHCSSPRIHLCSLLVRARFLFSASQRWWWWWWWRCNPVWARAGIGQYHPSLRPTLPLFRRSSPLDFFVSVHVAVFTSSRASWTEIENTIKRMIAFSVCCELWILIHTSTMTIEYDPRITLNRRWKQTVVHLDELHWT